MRITSFISPVYGISAVVITNKMFMRSEQRQIYIHRSENWKDILRAHSSGETEPSSGSQACIKAALPTILATDDFFTALLLSSLQQREMTILKEMKNENN